MRREAEAVVVFALLLSALPIIAVYSLTMLCWSVVDSINHALRVR